MPRVQTSFSMGIVTMASDGPLSGCLESWVSSAAGSNPDFHRLETEAAYGKFLMEVKGCSYYNYCDML